MMLFNSFGQQFGMLSGGCLESDIQTHARKVMQSGTPVALCYDGSDEDDISFQLGIGCGGTVYIMLHPVNANNQYQQLDKLYVGLKQRSSGVYQQAIPDQGEAGPSVYTSSDEVNRRAPSQVLRKDELKCLETNIEPEPHLLVIGGGIDARPVVTLASQLGWTVSLWDPRPANGRREFFMTASNILSAEVDELPAYVRKHRVNGAILMSHNIEMDAAALTELNGSGVDYMGLLGPESRKEKVLAQAGLTELELHQPLSGPAGLNIGGELPESIALSILSECHRVLQKPG